ncbi:UbiA family prenyltransferase [uncultured Agrococcus sp.]|uniref:UbiA family prenyltransferase n=1 Tax=uncultured Agrococcus sp. TaxID=382258 RepID=UPI0025E573FD|nr:UbiA family prenyltransferase [uncultured Agrococcus sp.]
MRVVWLLLQSTHPGPTLVVSAATCGLGIAASLAAIDLLVLVATVLLGQVSVGLSNDAIDAPRDRAAGRTDKPLAREPGLLRASWALSVVFGVLSIALSLILGWAFATAHLVFLLSGWLYNALLKATPLSVLSYVIGFGMLPSLPALVASDRLAPFWATCAGAALGIAIHCANVLPDIDDDRRAGILGFPQRLGRRTAGVVAAASLIAGAGIVASSAAASAMAVAWAFFAAVAVLAAVVCALVMRGRATRTVFRIVMLAAGLLVVQLMLTGGFTT